MKVRIVTDSASDLPQEMADALGIVIVPLHVRFGADELVDRQELTVAEFWARCAASPDLPETAAPSPGAFKSAFEALFAEGAEGVACVTLSSKLSATNEAASQAARAMPDGAPLVVLDSLSVTMGQGLMAVAAAEAASDGADLDQVVAAAESTRARLTVCGVIDTLENLRRGGRIGGAAAALGTLLSIKPVIEVRDGVVEQESKQRTRAKSLSYLAQKVRSAGPLERLAVVDAQAPDFAEFLALVADVRSTKPRVVGEIGPVIGTHAGPGTIGVVWVRESR
ncbi:MAG: DegV family protein [Acidimicrobiales bacterium]